MYHAELEQQRRSAFNGCQVVLASTASYDSRQQRDWASPFCSDVLLRDNFPLSVLLDVAKFYDDRALWLEAHTPASARTRKNTDAELYNYIVELTRVTRKTFGQSLYGVVATIASVLFEKPVSRTLVRSIVRQ